VSVVIYAIPIFFTLMGIELLYESISKRKTYRLNDAITNISTGTLQQVSGAFFSIIKVGIYVFIYNHFALFSLSNNWITFSILFMLYDLAYYWEHRMAHTISLFWGGHVVHHQSEDFNLSVALRQTSTGFIWGFPFYLPLALMGFDPKVFVLVAGLNLLYQFWIHTEHINKMFDWFEAIFNTPSHHRVHHGRDPKYIDKNFAGVFIIWDKLFGTFVEEKERPTYGITTPLQSWNPVYANFAHYHDIGKLLRKSRSLSDSMKILFKPPGWRPEYLGGYEAPTAPEPDYKKYDRQIALKMNGYVIFQFLILLAIVPPFFFIEKDLSLNLKIFYAFWIMWTTISFGLIFETPTKYFKFFEVLRLFVLPLYAWYLAIWDLIPMEVFYVLSVFAGLSVITFINLEKRNNQAIRNISI